ncbi:MAG: glycosyltransferase family 39 protein [Candidatus Saccharimonadales bacterium]
MKPSVLREILLYKYRYQTGIAIFIVVLVGLLFLRLDMAPTGVSQIEMSSAVASATFKPVYPITSSLVDLPYKLLQKASLSLFGITEVSIIAPSLLLGAVTGVAFLMMVRRWFRTNVALITSMIFVSSAAFLTVARTGTPIIMTTFWLSIILLAVTNILHPEGRSKLWAVVLLVALPLSLYTPLMIYPLLAIAIAGILHPHVRFMARRMAAWKYITAALAVIVLLLPLGLWLFANPSGIRDLTGVPAVVPDGNVLLFNFKVIAKSFFSIGTAIVGTIPQPIFGATSLIIITLGFFKTIADRHSARSYMLLIWTGLFIPVVLLNPDKILICLVPAYLFMAIGVETLIREWYKLFPLNPYARIAGLVPLVVLLGGIMLSNGAQYFYGHFYGTPNVAYKQQLRVTREVLETTKAETKVYILPTSQEVAFYDLLRRDYPNVTIHNSLSEKPVGTVVVHYGASYSPDILGYPNRIEASYSSQPDAVIARIFR